MCIRDRHLLEDDAELLLGEAGEGLDVVEGGREALQVLSAVVVLEERAQPLLLVLRQLPRAALRLGLDLDLGAEGLPARVLGRDPEHVLGARGQVLAREVEDLPLAHALQL
eukprot:2991990-Rhodomonas_salina.1